MDCRNRIGIRVQTRVCLHQCKWAITSCHVTTFCCYRWFFFLNAAKYIIILRKSAHTIFKSKNVSCFRKSHTLQLLKTILEKKQNKETESIDFFKITINHGDLFSKSFPLTPGWVEPEFSPSTCITRVVVIIARTRTVTPHISLNIDGVLQQVRNVLSFQINEFLCSAWFSFEIYIAWTQQLRTGNQLYEDFKSVHKSVLPMDPISSCEGNVFKDISLPTGGEVSLCPQGGRYLSAHRGVGISLPTGG